jgi:FkbM family methyltransferase
MTPSFKIPLAVRAARLFSWLPHYLGACERLFGSGLSSAGTCVVQTASGLSWKLDLGNSTHRWLVYGYYEGPALNLWMKKNLRTAAHVVVSGANIGQMIPGIFQVAAAATVHAFEPNREALLWLKESLALNPGLSVNLHESGLGKEAGSARLMNEGDSSTHGAQSYIGEGSGETIRIEKLDEVISSQSVDKIDLWILDVEGFELAVLTGALDLLSNRQIDAIWMEVSPETESAISAFLAGPGYLGFTLDSHGKVQVSAPVTEHCNLLYLPSDQKSND